MANVSEWSAAGLAALQVGPRNTSGFFNGYAELDAADTGIASGMHRLKGAITAPIGIQEPNRVPVRGDDGVVARFQFASDADNGFTLEMGVADLAYEAFSQGTTPYVLGEWDMGARGIPLPVFKDQVFLLTRKAQNEETGGAGEGFENMLVLSSQGLPIGDDSFAFQAEGGARYGCIANLADVLPWGVTVLAATIGASQVTTWSWYSQYPCSMDAFVGDGIIVAIPTTYTPISTAKSKVFRTDTAAESTVSSVSAGGKTITVSAAPVSAKLYVAIYECIGLL